MKNNNRPNINDEVFEKLSSQSAVAAVAFRYIPFWPIFVITIVISLTVSYFYIKNQNPVYEANAMILLKDQKSGETTDAQLLTALGISSSAKTVDNELEVLKSRTVLQQVVKDMGLYAQVYKKGRFRDNMIYPNPVKFVALNPDFLQNSPNLPISFQYIYTGNYIILGGKKYSLGVPVTTPYGEFTILPEKKYTPVPHPDKEIYYLQIRTIKNETGALLGSLTVAQGAKQSSLISLKFDDLVPFRAEDILNNLIRVYNKAGIDDKNATTANTLEFIENRLVGVSKDLSAVENNLQQYRTKEGIVNLSDEGRTFLENVQHNDQSVAQIQIELDVLDQIEKYIVQKGNRPGTVPATFGVTDPLLVQLLDKLYASELEMERQRQVSAENSPVIIALQEQIDQIKPSLLENIHTLRKI